LEPALAPFVRPRRIYLDKEDSMSLELMHLIGPGVAVVAVAVASGNIG
jgi:hypothetical protein